MPDARQLSLLTDLSQERRDAAARKLGQTLALLKESESRLSLLENYCADYRARLAASATQGVTVDEMRNFRQFIAKLDEAIGQQRREVETLRCGVTECRNCWMAECRKGRSFEVLSERADITARELESRRLQKLVDEFAGRVASLRVAN